MTLNYREVRFEMGTQRQRGKGNAFTHCVLPGSVAVNSAIRNGPEHKKRIANRDKTDLSRLRYGFRVRGSYVRCGLRLPLLPGEGNRGWVPLGCCARG